MVDDKILNPHSSAVICIQRDVRRALLKSLRVRLKEWETDQGFQSYSSILQRTLIPFYDRTCEGSQRGKLGRESSYAEPKCTGSDEVQRFEEGVKIVEPRILGLNEGLSLTALNVQRNEVGAEYDLYSDLNSIGRNYHLQDKLKDGLCGTAELNCIAADEKSAYMGAMENANIESQRSGYDDFIDSFLYSEQERWFASHELFKKR